MEGDGIRFNFLGHLPFGFLLLWLHDGSYGCKLWIGSSFRFMELGTFLFWILVLEIDVVWVFFLDNTSLERDLSDARACRWDGSW